jgi:regulator of RNase E activity RraA
VLDFRVPIEMNGVRVAPGDVVFGDLDGVCIVPRAAEDDVFRLALEKARGEQLVAKAIRDGMSAVEAFRTFGIM